MGIEGSLAGKRVVISTDGGRLRVRKNKRGKKTKKGRSRYRTDWREPKLLVIYVVDEKGRLAQEFAPVMDGTLQGPDEVFRLMEFYLRELGIEQAAEVLFIRDRPFSLRGPAAVAQMAASAAASVAWDVRLVRASP